MAQSAKPRIVGILLARMGSSRLPGKALAEIYGKSAIGHILERMLAFDKLDEIVLATPDSPENLPLQEEGRRYGVSVFAGNEDDVLDRLYQAAKAHQADIIVHVGGDQPFADPELMDKALSILQEKGADYVCNFIVQSYPSGQEQDVFTFEALEMAWRNATLKTHRKNALAYFFHAADQFNIEHFAYPRNMARHRWTLDYPEDLTFFQEVFSRLYPKKAIFTSEDILALLEREPELSAINAHLSHYSPDQPAYWDSEGYMSDLRDDLKALINKASQSDESGDLASAARDYKLALDLLSELHKRADHYTP